MRTLPEGELDGAALAGGLRRVDLRTVKRPDGTDELLDYKAPKTRALVSLTVTTFRDEDGPSRALAFFDSTDQMGRMGKVPTWPPSGLPFGEDSRAWFGSNGDMILIGNYGRVSVRAQINHAGARRNGKPEWHNEGYEALRRLGERMARLALANAATDELAPSARSAREDFATWAVRQGLNLRSSPETLTTVFLYKGKRVTVPLAATQVKVGSKWVPIGGLVTAQGRRPMVPPGFERALESALP